VGDQVASRWDERRVAALAAMVLALAGALWLAVESAAAWTVLVAGAVVATAVRPAIDRLAARRVPRWLAALVVFTALAGAALAVLLLALPVLSEQIAGATARLPGYYRVARSWLEASPSRVARQIARELPETPHALAPPAHDKAVLLGEWARSLLVLPPALFGLGAVVVVGFYWSVERDAILGALARAVPPGRRDGARAVVEAAEERVGAYLRGQAMLSTAMGLLSFGCYLALGLPHAALLGLFAAVTEIVPFVGPALGATPAVLTALALGPAQAGWTLLAFAVIQLGESYVLAPRILGRSVGLSAFTLLFSIAAFTALLGFAGALLALPAAAVIPLVAERLRAHGGTRLPERPDHGARDALRYEATLLALAARRLRGPREIAEEVESLATSVSQALDRPEDARAREDAA
jgi:predicted PurR-regulated permease PerM